MKKIILLILIFTFSIPISYSLPDKIFVKSLIDKKEWGQLEELLVDAVDNDKDVDSAKLLINLSNAGHIELHEMSLAIVMGESIRGGTYSSKLLGDHYYYLQDSDKAIYFYKRAASLGDVQVIAPIISIFVDRKDIVSSYTWASIGEARGLKDADKSLRDLKKYISISQEITALENAKNWLSKYKYDENNREN